MTSTPFPPTFGLADQALKVQFEGFLDEHRAALDAVLDGLTEDEARRSLVPSATTLLGLVKHVSFVERVWFGEAVTGRSRAELGIPAILADSFLLDDEDTIASVRAGFERASAASRAAAAGLDLDDILRGHRMGPVPLRWVYLHILRELAAHQGHAEILREQIVDGRSGRAAR